MATGGEKQGNVDGKSQLASLAIGLAVVVGARLIFALQPTAKADSASSIASEVSQPALSAVNTTGNASTLFGCMGFRGPDRMYRDGDPEALA